MLAVHGRERAPRVCVCVVVSDCVHEYSVYVDTFDFFLNGNLKKNKKSYILSAYIWTG